MEISDSQLYKYCYGISDSILHGFLKSSGNHYLSFGIEALRSAEENKFNKEKLKEALVHFEMAGKLSDEEEKVIAYLNACLCCYYLKDRNNFSLYKLKLKELTFSERTRKRILNMTDDPTGFKTIYKAIKTLITNEEYKNRFMILEERTTNFENAKTKALEAISKFNI